VKFTSGRLPGVFIIEPEVLGDARGFFMESYRRDEFKRHNIDVEFVQDNHSRSSKGTLRGLHYQTVPRAQAKLIRVMRGEIYDVVVDLRVGSSSYGKWDSVVLSADNRKMLYIPTGMAHGFLALQEGTEIVYKVSDYYSPQHERGVLWNDPDIGIEWPTLASAPLVLSEKDKNFPLLKEIR
jgi:dTDP-4-dehydrorhamnose 3,5-epimerase